MKGGVLPPTSAAKGGDMPSTDMILWAGLSGLIVMMLAVIGYLVKTGFEGLRAELTKIWNKLETNYDEITNLRVEVEGIKSRCAERSTSCPAGHHHHRQADEN